jgi:hypothetical protein
MKLNVLLLFVSATIFSVNTLIAQTGAKARQVPNIRVLDSNKWDQVDDSVEQGLAWLATQQNADGSFRTIEIGQPGVTAFCVMAFLAKGKTPADAEYGPAISKAIDFICAQQKRNGLLATIAPNKVPIPRVPNSQHEEHLPAVYNHSIAALALTEAYGECEKEQADKLIDVIERAVSATLEMQNWRKHRMDKGGWRYLGKPYSDDSDLSITGWQLMFLRSARNAGFEVPQENINWAVAYIEKCFQKQEGSFSYCSRHTRSVSRAMAGAGVLAMAHAGKHQSDMATQASNWILERDFTKFNHEPACQLSWQDDRYNYGVFLCTQAMYQQGGRYWKEFYPPVVDAVLGAQKEDGSWPAEPTDRVYGNCYTTALCVLSLSVSDQLLPIFQR